jgi:hypothetical protein
MSPRSDAEWLAVYNINRHTKIVTWSLVEQHELLCFRVIHYCKAWWSRLNESHFNDIKKRCDSLVIFVHGQDLAI